MTTVRRMTPTQLKAREAAIEAELDSRKTASERQAEGILAGRDEVVDDYDPSVDTSAQQAAMLLESEDD